MGLKERVAEISIPKLRKQYHEGNPFTETISMPFGICEDCESIGNGGSKRNHVLLYDLVELAGYLNGEEGKSRELIMDSVPFVEINGCEYHLERAIKECRDGKFMVDNGGIIEPLLFQVPDQILMHIIYKNGGSDIKVSYPIHPDIQDKVNVLMGRFLEIKENRYNRPMIIPNS